MGSTSDWVKFFTGAGFQSSVAASYALTFTKNKIQMDMLMDLNKEILKDMDITLMGDVIAILRHARKVHEETARNSVLSNAPSVFRPSAAIFTSKERTPSPTPVERVNPQIFSESAKTPKKSTPAARMLEHYMKNNEPAETVERNRVSNQKSATTRKNVTEGNAANLVLAKPKTCQKNVSVEGSINHFKQVKTPLRTIARPSTEVTGTSKSATPGRRKTVLRGTSPLAEEPIKKVRCVLPQTKPEAQGKTVHSILDKTTVFDRLGNESIIPETTLPESPEINITGLGSTIVKRSGKVSSVFDRLGGKTLTSSSIVPLGEMENSSPEESAEFSQGIAERPSLPYAGILKNTQKKKKVVIVKKPKLATMRADEEVTRLTPGKPIKKFVKNRLGSTGEVHSIKPKLLLKKDKATAGILGNPTNASRPSVKNRLGAGSPSSKNINVLTSLRNSSTALPKMPRKRSPIIYDLKDDTIETELLQCHVANKNVSFGNVVKKTFDSNAAVAAVSRLSSVGEGAISFKQNMARNQHSFVPNVKSRLGGGYQVNSGNTFSVRRFQPPAVPAGKGTVICNLQDDDDEEDDDFDT